jgi:CDP-diacylglycerol--serine O-phosphatidyltransferase
MVSRLPLLSFKFSKGKRSFDLPLILLGASALVGIWWLQWLAVPLLFVLYILLSLAFKKK